MAKLIEYKKLLSMNYDDAVETLLQKYGPVLDNYFKKKSYAKFLEGINKSIGKGVHTRTSEGLYTHHIDEINHLNLSQHTYIKEYKYPFELQKKERLVYCDLIEHAILHVLIAIESSFEYGFPGYADYIRPYIKEWYLDKKTPSLNWQKNCYNKAYLEPDEAFEILDQMNSILKETFSEYSSNEIENYSEINESLIEPETLAEYDEQQQKKSEEMKERMKKHIQLILSDRDKIIENSNNLTDKSPRADIVSAAYDLLHYYPSAIDRADFFLSGRSRSSSSELSFQEFDKKMKKYRKDEILKKLKKDISEKFNTPF